MIKAGEVAFLKTTGEAVYVLEIGDDPSPKLGDKELAVKVRRPVMGQNGITHVIDAFYLNELQSLEEQRAQFRAEREELYGKVGQAVPSEAPKFLA